MATVKKGSIRERTPGRWEITIDLGGLKPDGKRNRHIETLAGTKAAAEKRKRKLLVELDAGSLTASTRLTVSQWLTQWQGLIAPSVRQGTRDTYRVIIDHRINPSLGNVALQKLTALQIQQWENGLLETLAPSSVKQTHGLLSKALKDAVKHDLIIRNPCQNVTPPKQQGREIQPPTLPDVLDMLRLARADEHRLWAALHLCVYTGLRRGEVMGLRWENVNLADRYIRVEDSLVRTSDGAKLESPKTVTGKRRVDLDDATIDALIEHRAQQDAYRAFLGPAYIDQGIVFPSAVGGWESPRALYGAVKHYGQRVGWESPTAHKLRHFHASLMLQTGQNIAVISKRLGHARISITADIYSHALPGYQREAADAFGAAMASANSVGNPSSKAENQTVTNMEKTLRA